MWKILHYINIAIFALGYFILPHPVQVITLIIIIISFISLIRQVGSNKRKIQIKYKIQNKSSRVTCVSENNER